MMPNSELTAAELLAMPDDELKQIIEGELLPVNRRSHPEATSQALRSPVMVDRLYHMLIRMQRNTEGQLAAWSEDFVGVKAQLLGGGRPQAQYLKAKEEYAKRRARAIRFKSSLEMMIQEVKYLRTSYRAGGDGPVAGERDRLAAANARLNGRVLELEDAIRRHRDSFPRDDDPSDADLDLWALAAPAPEESDTP